MASGAEAEALAQQWPTALLARITGARKGVLFDGVYEDDTCRLLLTLTTGAGSAATRQGHLVSSSIAPSESAATTTLTPITRAAADQSNSSILFNRSLYLKLFRRIETGVNPDVEISERLTRRHFDRTPRLVATLSYNRAAADAATLAMVQEYVPNQGNG